MQVVFWNVKNVIVKNIHKYYNELFFIVFTTCFYVYYVNVFISILNIIEYSLNEPITQWHNQVPYEGGVLNHCFS